MYEVFQERRFGPIVVSRKNLGFFTEGDNGIFKNGLSQIEIFQRMYHLSITASGEAVEVMAAKDRLKKDKTGSKSVLDSENPGTSSSSPSIAIKTRGGRNRLVFRHLAYQPDGYKEWDIEKFGIRMKLKRK